jgi:hypothetical protein
MRGTRKLIAGFGAAALMLAFAAPAGAGQDPQAQASAEELVRYLTKGKLKVKKVIRYRMVCSEDCQVTVRSAVKVKGPDPAPLVSTASFGAGQVFEATVEPNKPLRNAMKAKLGATRLKTSVAAVSTLDGETDTDKRTFKFKK